MKILSSPVLEKNKKSSQLERLKTQGAKAFATASAYDAAVTRLICESCNKRAKRLRLYHYLHLHVAIYGNDFIKT